MTNCEEDETELVRRAWRVVFQRSTPANAQEEAAFEHLRRQISVLRCDVDGTDQATEERIVVRLRDELTEKLEYLDPYWGYIDAAAIVSRVDECAIALQAIKKREFLDPLSWDLPPHPAVLATVKAVLLLFDMKYPSHYPDEDIWSNCWALWIVKNIDSHASGWEWAATNEPTGLFTKPYALSATLLPQVRRLLETARATPDSHRCWHRMAAYACLRDWADACVGYVHLRAHYLPAFAAFQDVEKLLAPPRRTPQANVWFRLESRSGIEFFYNRLLQEIVLEKPDDFDGGSVATIPSVVLELVDEALKNDHATRLELERRGNQKIHDKLLAEDEWVQCVDFRTQQSFYYSFHHYRVSEMPPPSGVFLLYTESLAYKAVLRLQTAYRKRRLQLKLQVRRTKRASLPVFSSLASNKKYY